MEEPSGRAGRSGAPGPHRVGAIVAAAIVLCLLACGAAIASASGPGRRQVGAAARLPGGTKLLAAVTAGTHIPLTIALQPRDPAGLAAYARAVATPGSPLFHHYLTPSQFAERFGAAPGAVAAVRASLRAQGLDPGAPSANMLAVRASGTAAAVEQAMSTSLRQAQLPSGRVAYANTTAPSLSSDIAGDVQAVIGLSTVVQAQPLDQLAHARPQAVTAAPRPSPTNTYPPKSCPDAVALSPPSHTAQQIESAYGLAPFYGIDQVNNASVAVYELEGNVDNDLVTYAVCYGVMTNAQSQKPWTYTAVDKGGGSTGGTETELDVENILGLVPGVSVDVYQGPNAGTGQYDMWNAIVSANKEKVVSDSWGTCEMLQGPHFATAESTLFQEAATQGQTILAASGDTGSDGCHAGGPNANPPEPLSPSDPSSQPFVTGVGGTNLPASGSPSAWNNPSGTGSGGSGGGVSLLWQMPAYQLGAPKSLNVINGYSSGAPCGAPTGGYCREVPDISADADATTGYAFYDSTSGGWVSGGGTSAAAPAWAAIVALANGSKECAAGGPVGFMNPSLYGLAAGPLGPSVLTDVTTGNSDYTGTGYIGGLFPAGPGYDLATGLGTPLGTQLASALCDHVTFAQHAAFALTAGVPQSPFGTAPASNQGQQITSATATGLPPGMTMSSAGVISGTPNAPGNYTATVTATDAYDVPGTQNYSFAVTPPSVAVNGVQNGLQYKSRSVKLQLTAGDSAMAPLTWSATGLPPGLFVNSAGLISGTLTAIGKYQITATARDQYGGSGSTAFSFAAIGLPTASHYSLGGVGAGTPVLKITVTVGSGAPGFQLFKLTLPTGATFSTKTKNIRAGIKILGSGGKPLVKVTGNARGRTLSLTLPLHPKQIKLQVAAPAFTVKRSLAKHKVTLEITLAPSQTTLQVVGPVKFTAH